MKMTLRVYEGKKLIQIVGHGFLTKREAAELSSQLNSWALKPIPRQDNRKAVKE